MNDWTLYKHTTPSGKVYIGITCQKPEYRWNNGKGYMNCKKSPFKSAIIRYGWENIKHEIIFNSLTEKEAKEFEKLYIKHYKSLHISLNVTEGGEGVKGVIPWNKGKKVPYEKSNKRKGCRLTEEHKRKLSIAHIGKSPKSANLYYVYDYNGIFIGKLKAADIIKQFGGCGQNISRAHKCRGIYMKMQYRLEEDKGIGIKRYDPINNKVAIRIVAENLITGEKLTFDSQYDFPRYLGMPPKKVFDSIKRKGHYKHWIYKQLEGEEE